MAEAPGGRRPRAGAPAAVLWDMDGTLADSEPLWLRASADLASSYGATWDHDDTMRYVGRPTAVTAQALRDRGVAMPVRQIVDELAASVARQIAREAPWFDGAREMVETVAELGVPQALVTSSPRVVAEALAEHAVALRVVVAGDDGIELKPDPAPYLRAAELLGVDVREAIAVEDSPSGIEAATTAGARVIAVESALPVRPRAGMMVVSAVSELTRSDLCG